jgi:hypothetical protein
LSPVYDVVLWREREREREMIDGNNTRYVEKKKKKKIADFPSIATS